MTREELEVRKQEIREAIRQEQDERETESLREARERRMPERAVPFNENQETR